MPGQCYGWKLFIVSVLIGYVTEALALLSLYFEVPFLCSVAGVLQMPSIALASDLQPYNQNEIHTVYLIMFLVQGALLTCLASLIGLHRSFALRHR